MKIAKANFTLTLLVVATVISTYSASLHAQTVRFVPPSPSQDEIITSGRRQGGANRGDCPAVANKPLTALVPASLKSLNPEKQPDLLNTWESVWGQTLSASPTLWFYLPYSPSKLPLLFVLQNQQRKTLYKTYLTSAESKPGIVKVALPSTFQLEVGKMYRWYFIVDCDPDAPPEVQGWIQRVSTSPTLTTQLKQASPQQRVALYAANGIWYDALTTSAQLRNADPEDPQFTADWVNLLNSAGLNAIATEPIRNCCTPEKRTANLR